MSVEPMDILAIVLAAGAGVAVLALLVGGRTRRIDTRLQELARQTRPAGDRAALAQLTQTTLTRMAAPLVPEEEEQRTLLQSRLMHAGMYGANALMTFLGVKMMLMALPVLLGLFGGVLGFVEVTNGLYYGLAGSALGMVGPSMWLDSRKAARQAQLRRSLPDALDVIVICLEGGISLPAALQKVVAELRFAHPQLAAELAIVEREVIVGLSTGEALRRFADRCDLEEVSCLATVVLQSERFGASVVKTLRQHSETLRVQRLMRGEELAQKASVKIVFPTLLFIFPAVFLVLAGPAMFQIWEMMANMNK